MLEENQACQAIFANEIVLSLYELKRPSKGSVDATFDDDGSGLEDQFVVFLKFRGHFLFIDTRIDKKQSFLDKSFVVFLCESFSFVLIELLEHSLHKANFTYSLAT